MTKNIALVASLVSFVLMVVSLVVGLTASVATSLSPISFGLMFLFLLLTSVFGTVWADMDDVKPIAPVSVPDVFDPFVMPTHDVEITAADRARFHVAHMSAMAYGEADRYLHDIWGMNGR